jgi:hypothetical protein
MVRLLLVHGADVNDASSDNSVSPWRATNQEVIHLLLEYAFKEGNQGQVKAFSAGDGGHKVHNEEEKESEEGNISTSLSTSSQQMELLELQIKEIEEELEREEREGMVHGTASSLSVSNESSNSASNTNPELVDEAAGLHNHKEQKNVNNIVKNVEAATAADESNKQKEHQPPLNANPFKTPDQIVKGDSSEAHQQEIHRREILAREEAQARKQGSAQGGASHHDSSLKLPDLPPKGGGASSSANKDNSQHTTSQQQQKLEAVTKGGTTKSGFGAGKNSAGASQSQSQSPSLSIPERASELFHLTRLEAIKMILSLKEDPVHTIKTMSPYSMLLPVVAGKCKLTSEQWYPAKGGIYSL